MLQMVVFVSLIYIALYHGKEDGDHSFFDFFFFSCLILYYAGKICREIEPWKVFD